jgi:hypothetical protein
MCCFVKASQQSLGTFIWSQDINARVNKGDVMGLHFYKEAWQIYIKGRMSEAQSDGIIGSRIKTWLTGRQKAMIIWSASRVVWEKHVGLAVCWSQETLLLGGYQQTRILPWDIYIYLLENKQRLHWDISLGQWFSAFLTLWRVNN